MSHLDSFQGTVFTIGLQLNKHQWKFQNNSNNSESSWLQYITYALPLNKSSTGDIDQKTSHNSFTELKVSIMNLVSALQEFSIQYSLLILSISYL